MALYEDIYNGKKLTFDLAEKQTCFRMNKNFTIQTIREFLRKIKTKYEEKKDNEYFE